MPALTQSRCCLFSPKRRAEVVAFGEDCLFANIKAVGKGVEMQKPPCEFEVGVGDAPQGV